MGNSEVFELIRLIAEDIAFFLIKNRIVDIERRDEYVYGAEVLLLNLINIIMALVISIVSKSLLHFIAFIIVFAPLRIFTGGYHAKTTKKCFIVFTMLYVLSVVLVKAAPKLYTNSLALVGFATTLMVVILCAPIVHTNNPLSAEEHQRNRLVSIILAIIDSLLFILLYSKSASSAASIMIFVYIIGILMILALFTNKPRRNKSDEKDQK